MTTKLYDAGWFSYNEDSNGVNYIQEAKDGVTVLCYDSTKPYKPFLLLHEACSAFRSKEPKLVSLTGSIDPHEKLTPLDTAVRELAEEAGVVVNKSKLTYLGSVFTYKACTKATYLFLANIAGCEWVDALGDGSETEANAYVKWHSLEELLESKDSLLLATYARSVKHFNKELP
jgi:8-oxo-dGTP pyrophosphatase MutT (NUDIX family)